MSEPIEQTTLSELDSRLISSAIKAELSDEQIYALRKETLYPKAIVPFISKGEMSRIRVGSSQPIADVAQQSPPMPPDEVKQSEVPEFTSTPAENIKVQYDVKEISARKKVNEKLITNILLYVASFLIVGAAALFVNTGTDDSLKFLFAWAVTAIFYGSGLAVHKHVERLQPAAIAFVGTGLALLPFAGWATNEFFLNNELLSYFFTSAVAVGTFLYATIQLRSQVLIYMTIGSFFSLVLSSSLAFQPMLIGNFASIIVASIILSLTVFFKPKFLPKTVMEPIDNSAQIAVVLAIGGAVISSMEFYQIGLIGLLATVHYAVSAFFPNREKLSELYLFAARAFISATVLVFCYDYYGDWSSMAIALLAISLVQIIASALIERKFESDFNKAWVWIGFAGYLAALIAFAGEHSYSSSSAVLGDFTTGVILLAILTVAAVVRCTENVDYSWVVLAALTGVFIEALEIWQIGTVLAVASAYYSSSFAYPVNRALRQFDLTAARLLGSATALVFVYYFEDWTYIAIAILAIAWLQLIASAILEKKIILVGLKTIYAKPH